MVIEGNNQLASDRNLEIEAQRAESLKGCVEVGLLESALDCKFIDGVDFYEDLDDKTLRSSLDGKFKESKILVTLSSVADLVPKKI